MTNHRSSPLEPEPVAVDIGRSMHVEGSERWETMLPEEKLAQEKRRIHILRGVISVAASETQRLREENEAGRIDGLTDMFNQSAWQEIYPDYVMRAQSQAERGVDTGLVLMIVDADGLKYINDNHKDKHQAGNKGLKKGIAEAIKRVDRPGDVEARIGGDEFAVLFEGVIPNAGESYDDTINRIAGYTQTEIDTSIEDMPDLASMGFGASIGIAHFEPGMSAEGLFALADTRMYDAKIAKNAQR